MEQSLKETTIAQKFREIMELLELDLKNPSLKGTPDRVAKMYVNELFYGLDKKNEPKITTFPNEDQYSHMLVERDIKVNSVCCHHFVPIIGVAHIAYIPQKIIVGLSKLHRVVDYFSRKPQIQENLGNEILVYLRRVLKTPDVAVVLSCEHYCVKLRGVMDQCSSTVTSHLGGVFLENGAVRNEMFNIIKLK